MIAEHFNNKMIIKGDLEVIDDIVNGSPYYSSSGQLETLEGEVSDLKNLCQKLLTVLVKNEIMSGEELCELARGYEVV